MPNHVMNILTVKGKNSKKVFEAFTDEQGRIDFMKVLPMPSELLHIQSPVRVVRDDEYEAAVQKARENEAKIPGWGLSLPLTSKMQSEYLQKFGADNWYTWALNRWGTKWNAYRTRTKKGKIFFETAWSTPAPVIKALSKMFPDNEICITYADEDIGSNCGAYSYKNGKEVSGRGWGRGDASIKFARAVWRRGNSGKLILDTED